MTRFNELANGLQKNHKDLVGLIASLREALNGSDLKKGQVILERIEEVAAAHFRFEKDYLYPRMRRLVFNIMDRLNCQQETVRRFIKESKVTLSRGRNAGNRLRNISETLPVVSTYLNDCNDLAILANKFGKEEERDLTQKFKEYCAGREGVAR